MRKKCVNLGGTATLVSLLKKRGMREKEKGFANVVVV